MLALPAIIFVVACFAFSAPAHAAQTVPYKINFQGRLTNASGITLTGSYDMQFKLYTAVTGGTYVWGETRTAANTNPVTVTSGLFSVLIGEGTAVAGSSASLQAAVTANSTLYIEITIGAETLSPRTQFGSSAYAINSDMIDGIDGASLAQLATGNAFTNTNSITTSNASAFVVNNGTNNIFKVDTSGTGQIVVGTSDANGTVLVLDSNASDPTGTNGAMYYNSGGKFRCYQAGAWADCITATATLQTAYNASGTPATITTTAAKGVSVVAGAVPTDDLFTVDNSSFAVTTDNVNGIDVNYVGGAAAVEAAGMRIDYTPGTTSGGVWSGLRVVANPTGTASGVTSYGIKIEGPASPGSGSEVGLQVAGGFDIGIDIASGSLQLAAVTNEPAAPATGSMKIYAKEIAGRMILKSVGPSGLDTPYQPALFANNVAMILPSTSTTITVWGMPNTTVGTASTPTIANTNFKTAMRRTTITSATTANSASELRSAQMLVWRGNGAGLGGFFYASRFSINSTTANQRLFSGLVSSTAATSTSIAPSAILNMIGVGWDSADTNLQIMSNDASGTATKVDLGSGYPANDTTAVYELILYATANASSVGYRVQRLDTNTSTSGTITATLPASNLMLTHHQYMNNGGTAAAVALEVNRVYIESDY